MTDLLLSICLSGGILFVMVVLALFAGPCDSGD